MSNQQLAERPQQRNDLRVMIQSDTIQQQLAMALPRYYSPDQFTVIVRTAINKNTKLGECDPGSFMTSMITGAQMGIAPDGRNGYLIPRWNSKTNRQECTFMPSYIGLIGLVRKNPEVADIYAETVHAEDVFRITKGLHRDIVHEVDVKKNRGPIIGAYSVISYKDGRASWEFMSREEIESVRARSDSWRAHVAKGYDTPWKTDEGEMFKKTVLKRLIKTADISQETADRIAIDNTIDSTADTSIREIKTADIPERPALPEPSQEQDDNAPKQPYPEPELEKKPDQQSEKRGPGRPKKLGAKAPENNGEPAEKPVTKADKVMALVTEKGFTKAEFVKAAFLLEIAHPEWGNLVPDTIDIGQLGDENLDLLLDPDNEGQVLEYLTQAREFAK